MMDNLYSRESVDRIERCEDVNDENEWRCES